MNEQFEEMDDYDAEISEHVRLYLLKRKIDLQDSAIYRIFKTKDLSVLDIGCGTGWHMLKMQELGYKVSGLDASVKQCEQAKKNTKNIDINNGSVIELPYADNSFDVVYTINTIHHLPEIHNQIKAFSEINRVLKKTGICIIHEINIKNPVIRFYMDYIFPKIKNIDDGRELWLKPSEIDHIASDFKISDINYYTFLPDFTPKFLMKPVLILESLLERSFLNPYSAHYMCVLEKK